MRPKRAGRPIKLPLNAAVAFLILASASLVEAQTLQTLRAFNGTNGSNPNGLTLGTDGYFYGTTFYGGITNSFYTSGMGTAFKVTTNGTLTTLVSFSYTNGALPSAELTLGNDGGFYGTTVVGGGVGSTYGTVFKVTTNGTLTTLVSFSDSNGSYPQAPLTLGNDGIFYGTTEQGGSSDYGTVFKVTTNGTLTTLVSFSGSNGAQPEAGLTLGNDGSFYGTTWEGGSSLNNGYGYGTVFKVTTNGTLTTLVSFSGTNGAQPEAGLTLGSDGNFYGTTLRGGITNSKFASGMGTVFQVTTNGTLSTLVSFSGTNGAQPIAGLTPGNDGRFYGTTWEGGSSLNNGYGYGTVFYLSFRPVITDQPRSQTNNAGTTTTILVGATGLNPIAYQWQKNGTNLVDGSNISGSTTSTLSIASILDSDAAHYSVILSNSYGSVTSSIVKLTVVDPPVITVQPANLLVLLGTNAVFGISVTSAGPLSYQWRFNGTNIPNGRNALYSIPSVSTNNAGNYAVVTTNSAGSATSSNATLTVVLSPQSQTNYASTTATFTATAFSPEVLSYQWQKNGTNLTNGGNLSGTTNRTLTITSVSDADAASYSAVVSDAYASVTTSNAVLTVNDYLFIASQPQSQTVGLGSNVVFSVTVYGAPPFLFQWYFNETPVGLPSAGTNVSSYAFSIVETNQAGNYSVKVVNGYGSLMSSNAALTVKVFPPTIDLQPSSQKVMMGKSASFRVSVNGTPPFCYQWRFNGTNLLNATNAAYLTQAVGATNAGNYSVVVTNPAGSATSSNALLTVTISPTLALQLLAGYPLLNLDGMLSSNFVVQFSTNLAATNWVNLLSLTNLSASPYQFLDPAGDGEPARFYRAFMR